MLLFIGKVLHPNGLSLLVFQNISCYCLSLSHTRYIRHSCRFQNISCYCLSMKAWRPALEFIVFQNISSYCLSCYCRSVCRFIYISKHLMLLFIPIETELACIVRDFKTSHVIVYPNRFIATGVRWEFQNISCYCLSQCR